MAGWLNSTKDRRGFTIVELLIVIAVILVLVSIMVKVWPELEERIIKFRCQLNLTKAHKILLEYGANNYGYLPPMSGSNHMGVIEYPSSERNYVVEELKSYGARADIFTCPASPIYEDENSYKWYCWTEAIDNWNHTQKVAYTDGYVFFIGFWPWISGNTRYGSHFFGSGGKPLATRVDSPGNPPLAADLMRFDNGGTIYGRVWKGFYHRRDTEEDAPGGGGYTLFLNGAVNWFIWEEFEDGMEANPQTQPVWWGSWPQWSYFAGWAPKETQ